MEENGLCWGGSERSRFRTRQGKGGKGKVCKGKGWLEPQVLCPKDLCSWRDVVGWDEGVIYWLMGKGGASFPLGGCDYPKVGMCGGLLAQILILLQTLFVHLVVRQIHDRRQLIKVEAVTQSHLRALSESSKDSLARQIVTRGRQLTKVLLWASS